jgi:hypothetical protein
VCHKWGHKGTYCHSKDKKQASNTYKKFEGECHNCHKKGHMKKDCFKKKNNEKDQGNQASDSKKKKKKKSKKEEGEETEIVLKTTIDLRSEQNVNEEQEVAFMATKNSSMPQTAKSNQMATARMAIASPIPETSLTKPNCFVVDPGTGSISCHWVAVWH